MRTTNHQSGFAVIAAAIVVLVLAAVGFSGWQLYQKHTTATTTASTTATPTTAAAPSPVANNVSTAPTVNSTKDLDTALNTLNQNDPGTTNASDSSQLDSQTSTF